MVGVWVAPILAALKLEWHWFAVWWLLYSVVTGFVVKLALEKPVRPHIPR